MLIIILNIWCLFFYGKYVFQNVCSQYIENNFTCLTDALQSYIKFIKKFENKDKKAYPKSTLQVHFPHIHVHLNDIYLMN